MPTFRELQSELKKRGIKAKGKKADLQALLDQDNERLQIEAAGPKVTDKRAAPLPAAVVAVSTDRPSKRARTGSSSSSTTTTTSTSATYTGPTTSSSSSSFSSHNSSSSSSSTTATTKQQRKFLNKDTTTTSTSIPISVGKTLTTGVQIYSSSMGLCSTTLADNKKRGRSKSGRSWKIPQKRTSNNRSKAEQKRLWDKKELGRTSYKAMKDLEKDFIQNREDERKARIEKLIAKRKRKAANEMKNSTFQTMTNDNKIKRMTKNQLKLVKKMQVNVYTGQAELVSPWAGNQIRGKHAGTWRGR